MEQTKTGKLSAIKRLPFDQYSRQSRAAQLVDLLRKKGESFNVLDVGGYKGVTKDFHPHDKVTILDVFDVTEKGYVKGDATNMSFADGSYDFVVSFDVFEHIPREKRKAFMSECARVARRGVIVAAPVGTKENAQAELDINDLNKSIYGTDHRWLKEHIDYELPEMDAAEKLMQSNNLHTIKFSSNYLPAWVLMQATIIGASKYTVLGEGIPELYEAYNDLLPADGVSDIEQNYRLILLGLKDKKDFVTAKKNISNVFMDKAKFFKNYTALATKVSCNLVMAVDKLESQINNERQARLDTEKLAVAQQAELSRLREKYDSSLVIRGYARLRQLFIRRVRSSK